VVTTYWIEKGISTLLLLIFVFLGFLSFGYPLYFDRLFLVILSILIISYNFSKNLFFIGLILLVGRLAEELIYQIYSYEFTKVIIYLLGLITIYKMRLDKYVVYLITIFLTFCIVAEIYWYLIGYNSPAVHYYIALLCLNSLIRYFLICRVHLVNQHSSIEVYSIPLDFSLYNIIGVSNWIISIMTFEYLFRHITSYPITLMYDAYSYLNQFVSVVILYLIVSFITKSRFKLLA